jgi:transcriptional regulator with XRE-family HTH domain
MLGKDVRTARLIRGMSVADLAIRASTSASSVTRLEKGDRGVGIGTFADILVVLGLVERLGDLIDIRKDELGLALVTKQLPQRGKSFASASQNESGKAKSPRSSKINPDGMAF